MEVAPCIELIPGANYYVVPEKATPIPRDFVDLNTYYYRLVEGEMKLKGIALGPGWELRNFDAKKLSCYKQKGRDNEMASKKREAPPKEELLALYIKHEGKIDRIRKELGISWLDAKKWLVEAGIIDSLGKPASTSNYNFEWCGPRKRQTPTPEPVQAANQEPERETKEPATKIISEPYRKCEDCGKGLTCEEVQEINPDGYVNEKSKILCSWCYSNYLNRQIPPEPVKMPIGCSLPLENTTEAEQEEMAKSDTVQEEEVGEYVTLDIEWPPNDAAEKALLEAIINAYFAVRRVLKLGSGAV